MIPLILLLGLASGESVQTRIRGLYPGPLRDQVTLSLTSDRSSYYLREPIRLTLTLKNVQDQPVRGVFLINPLSPKAVLRYGKAGSTSAAYPYPGRKGGYGESIVDVPPQGEVAGETTLAFDAARGTFVLDEAGQYEFQVIYQDAPQQPTRFWSPTS